MKTRIIFLLAIILSVITFNTSYSITKVINVSDFAFTPQNETAEVGDTIKWIWVSGFHTTTSTSIPAGALSWDELITPAIQTYIYVLQVPGTYNYVCTPHVMMGMTGTIVVSIPTGIQQITGSAENYKLSQNFPNPFNPVTKISFNIPVTGYVKISVYDAGGKQITELVNGIRQAGEYLVDFNASGLSTGVYFYRLTAGEYTEVRKMMYVK
ncbi:MAG: T9SS type A sorting domain-containing protein [Ignavibacteria bacterium]|nr:T9SS type A sorting domain-containing protein [Ignavibacteria bacterium]